MGQFSARARLRGTTRWDSEAAMKLIAEYLDIAIKFEWMAAVEAVTIEEVVREAGRRLPQTCGETCEETRHTGTGWFDQPYS
jgi:hypothetical protein